MLEEVVHASLLRAKSADASLAQQTALHCPSLCIPCAAGQKAVLLKRSKGFWKKVLDTVALPSLLIPPWAATLLAGERAFIHHLGDECPDLEVFYLEPDGARKLPDSVLTSLRTKDSVWMDMLFKNFGKLWQWEQTEKGVPQTWGKWVSGVWIYHRLVGAMPDPIQSFFEHADMICGDDEGVWKLPENNTTPFKTAIQEEGAVQDFLTKLPIIGRESFYQHCENMAKQLPE